MHIDLETDDVEAEVQRLEALGAVRWDHQLERGFDFWVMRDPWGNEFCVLQPEFPELLAEREPWQSLPSGVPALRAPECRALPGSRNILAGSARRRELTLRDPEFFEECAWRAYSHTTVPGESVCADINSSAPSGVPASGHSRPCGVIPVPRGP
jgi:hypothetical protein